MLLILVLIQVFESQKDGFRDCISPYCVIVFANLVQKRIKKKDENETATYVTVEKNIVKWNGNVILNVVHYITQILEQDLW